MIQDQLSQPYRPNPALRALYRRFFERISVDQNWVARVRELALQGHVVFVLRNLNIVDFVALDHIAKRFGLPEVRFASDLGLWVLNPMGKGWLNAIFPRRSVEATELRAALEAGGSAVLFLKRPPGVLDVVAAGASGRRGLKEGEDLVQALIELQRERDKPIFLLPQLFLWTKRPDTRGTRLMDWVLGPREWASPLRTLAQFLSNYKHIELKSADVVNLSEFLQSYPKASDAELRRRLTYTVLGRLERERRSVTGPAGKSPERVRQEIVRSPRFRAELSRLTRGGTPESELLAKSLHMLKAMQATPDGATMRLLEVALDTVFARIYAGIDVDAEGVARLREEAKEKCLVFLPSHKSHMDYLILSYAFNNENLPLPLIAAGDNLTFFPMGPIFRRAGAFFIRRSFRGDSLYPLVVDAYVRRLIREGFAVEMFLEGGRSRTGKLLPPKFGLLKMVVGAALAVQRPVAFVPVSIGYERVVDSYEVELGGGEKVSEDAAGLLSATRILKKKYGRINIQFGQVLSLEQLRSELGLPEGALTPAKQRALVTRLGNRVMDEINRVTAVTPGALTAMGLLSYHRRGQSHEKLLARCRLLLSSLRELGARCTPGLLDSGGQLRSDAIREALQMFTDGELIEVHYPAEVGGRAPSRPRAGQGAIYTVPEAQRLRLDGSKNIIIHFFVERALVATSLLLPPGGSIRYDVLSERVQELSKLFKHEFRFRADADFTTIFNDTIASMLASGDLLREGDALVPGRGRGGWSGRQWLMTYASLCRNFFEAYRIAARGLAALERGPIELKDLVKQTLTNGRLMYLSGEVQLAEAVSKPLLENAFQAFQDLKLVTSRDGHLELSEPSRSPEALRKFEQSIAAYLERETQ